MNTRNKKITSLLLCMILMTAMTFSMAGCGDKQSPTNPSTESRTEANTTVLGEGATKILFTVVDKEGNETYFEIHTDKEIVGDALFEHNLIAGNDGPYGLYVTEVNGITADYDVDATYWAFYINDAYAASGVDTTPIKEGETYCFKVEK